MDGGHLKKHMTYAIDFETYYDDDYSLQSKTHPMGTDQYIRDERFDPYLLAVRGPDYSFVGHPSEFDWTVLDGQDLVAHNARFDETVLIRMKELGLVDSSFSWGSFFCTADLASYLHCPRNLGASSRLLLDRPLNKQTREDIKGLGSKEYFTLPDAERKAVTDYGGGDADACYDIYEKYSGEWPEHENRLSQFNRQQGRRGVQIDTAYLRESLDALQVIRWQAEKSIPWDWSKNKTPLAPTKLKLECRREGIPCPASLAATSQECADWEEEYGNEYPWVGAMRDWRRSNILVKRLETIDKRLTSEGVFPFSLLYFGSHTGRWSGADGYNMQNMLRKSLYGVDLRKHFLPRPGNKFLIIDLSQIEARVLLWLVGDFEGLEMIAKGFNVYEAHAIRTMGMKPGFKDDPRYNWVYPLAKARVLGLGYQCGAERFISMAKILAGVTVTPQQSEDTVMDFRETNPKITSYWRNRHTDCLRSRGEDLELELPSGRWLKYFNIQTLQYMSGELLRGTRRTSLYGGKLTENITQAVARDVFAEGMVRLVDAGHTIAWHVHDECILEVPEDFDDTESVLSLITQTPEWLPGCPISADAKYAQHYLKG